MWLESALSDQRNGKQNPLSASSSSLPENPAAPEQFVPCCIRCEQSKQSKLGSADTHFAAPTTAHPVELLQPLPDWAEATGPKHWYRRRGGIREEDERTL